MNQSGTIERNETYWDEFYAKNNIPDNPSSFAKMIINHIDKKTTLLELGCGNGRDSFYFAKNNIKTIALDLSQKAIKNNSSFKHDNVEFKVADFTNLNDNEFENLGTIYSRFTLHSVSREAYLRTIDWCYRNLPEDGKFYIEARTINDPLYGRGTEVGIDEFVTTHYRRFLDIKEVISDLKKTGFHLMYALEDYLDSWYKDDYAVVLRICCKK